MNTNELHAFIVDLIDTAAKSEAAGITPDGSETVELIELALAETTHDTLNALAEVNGVDQGDDKLATFTALYVAIDQSRKRAAAEEARAAERSRAADPLLSVSAGGDSAIGRALAEFKVWPVPQTDPFSVLVRRRCGFKSESKITLADGRNVFYRRFLDDIRSVDDVMIEEECSREEALEVIAKEKAQADAEQWMGVVVPAGVNPDGSPKRAGIVVHMVRSAESFEGDDGQEYRGWELDSYCHARTPAEAFEVVERVRASYQSVELAAGIAAMGFESTFADELPAQGRERELTLAEAEALGATQP